MEDFQIIDLYHHRKEQAIGETADKYGRLLFCLAHDVLHSHEDSEETVNDTYISAWNAMPPQRPTALCAFLSRITRNLAISRWRKSHAQKREGILQELSDFETDGKTADDDLNLKELTASIEKFLLKQSKDDRILFVRRYFFAIPVATLAEEFSTTEPKLTGRLYRLRQKLKTTLTKEGYAL